ncbi:MULTISPECIES: hypothetical protein [Myroides]|uniref:Lipoprotein n=1 Tax=Myroides albus TaxID=2562892 RepID=A0A6I3LMT7_9FLAO|nr:MULTISPECIES: hypothetical protein [Myroides]MTG97305.1 hypothetical protein [Myroides albus]MVX35847.1 hypothetical protein [Myroides sp. LoEW2-1]UVD80608.1 hypothetical protein NWE55_04970 [Myroides albus]
MRHLGLTLLMLSLFTVGCKDKAVKVAVIEKESKVEVIQEQVKTNELRLAVEDMEAYMDSEDKMMASLGDADQLRLQKAIQIIGNYNIVYSEDDGIDNDKTDAVFLKLVGGKIFSEVCELAEGYLREDKQRELDRIQALLGSIKTPEVDSEVERFNEAQQNLKEADKMPITLDDYEYNEECFL